MSLETVYTTQDLVVMTNGCGEIFVANQRTGRKVRLTAQGDNIVMTTQDAFLVSRTSNLPAIRVVSRR